MTMCSAFQMSSLCPVDRCYLAYQTTIASLELSDVCPRPHTDQVLRARLYVDFVDMREHRRNAAEQLGPQWDRETR